MTLAERLNDHAFKPNAKTTALSNWLLGKKITPDEIIAFAKSAKDVEKAHCIEALEQATKQNPTIINKKAFLFVTKALTAKAPRVKWESARVIGNTVHLFPNRLDEAIINLLNNTEHKGMIVRWSAAFALGEIVKLKTKYNKQLLPAIEAILKSEEHNSIKKIYVAALKKLK